MHAHTHAHTRTHTHIYKYRQSHSRTHDQEKYATMEGELKTIPIVRKMLHLLYGDSPGKINAEVVVKFISIVF